ncbi:unnamed protein product [Brachionus calyciflorus]|uniref:HTH CENPB-type domain-containing protein n=1 Tax=Brachionus calyciflorus TaxID=104777 RepID=A0A814HCK6_9BILA|nr:unnamed protein product [Brachionus calyciflorus]
MFIDVVCVRGPLNYQQMEREIIEWINESRANGACLSGKCIKTKALGIADELIISNFKASRTKRVVANTSGNERKRISITVCVSTLGTKLPLVVVVPRKRPLKDFNPPQNVVIIYKPNGTFDSETIKTDFLQRVFLPHWTQWFLNDSKSFTKIGNLRSPGYAKAIGWLSEIWNELDSSIIKTSFEVCVITSNNDEDFHSTLKTFLQSGPIDEYLETNDGENDIDGFDNHCETDDEVNDQDDDVEEISEEEGLDEDEVESSNDSIDGIVESNVEYDTENELIGELTSDEESILSHSLNNTIQSSSTDENTLYMLNASSDSNLPQQNENFLSHQKVKCANRLVDGVNYNLIGKNNSNMRSLEENFSLRRSKRIKKV